MVPDTKNPPRLGPGGRRTLYSNFRNSASPPGAGQAVFAALHSLEAVAMRLHSLIGSQADIRAQTRVEISLFGAASFLSLVREPGSRLARVRGAEPGKQKSRRSDRRASAEDRRPVEWADPGHKKSPAPKRPSARFEWSGHEKPAAAGSGAGATTSI